VETREVGICAVGGPQGPSLPQSGSSLWATKSLEPAGIFGTVRIAFGTDEETPLTLAMRSHLEGLGHQVIYLAQGLAWPEVGRQVADAVAGGSVDRGVVCCYTGTGVSIAANKVAGIRAALCTDAATAAGSRRWNDSNVLAIGLRLASEVVATEMLDAFITTPADAGELETITRVESP
jgi:ribose 5-phosphate isomerase B